MRENPQPMRNRSFQNTLAHPLQKPAPQRVSHPVPSYPVQRPAPTPASKPSYPSQPPKNELTRVFNTALVSTQVSTKRDFSTELSALTNSAPFKSILNAVKQLSSVQGISERQAAEEIIATFRKMDDIWGDYILKEGLDRLRGSKT